MATKNTVDQTVGRPLAMRELQDEAKGNDEDQSGQGDERAHLDETAASTSTISSQTSSSPLLPLPIELFALILADLPLESYGTLANLCLVCRALLPTARDALYGRLEFCPLRLGDAWVLAPGDVGLLRSLRTSEHLPQRVKALECWTMNCDADDFQEFWGIDIHSMIRNGGWTEEWLREFTKENGIDIEATWHELLALVAPHVRRLSTTSVPEHLFDFEPHLAACSFPNAGALEVVSLSPALVPSFPSLTELNCRICPLSLLPPSTPPPALQTLSLTRGDRLDASRLPVVAWLTSSSHTTLRTLSLPFTDTFPSDTFLSSFPNLLRLTLKSAQYACTAGDASLHPPERRLPPIPPSLTELTLGCLSQCPSPSTALTNTMLSSLSAPNLISLTLTAPTFSAHVFAPLVADVERLPRLRVLDAEKMCEMLTADEVQEASWDWDAREELQKACDGRGVMLRLPPLTEDGDGSS